MKKEERMAAYLGQLHDEKSSSLEPCYRAYFQCFNEQHYFEAHDVLEHLWLKTSNENHLFYKALIQVAGAFVHLQKQFLRPTHRVDGGRLRPAVRLFRLATGNLAKFRPRHEQLDVEALCQLCDKYAAAILLSKFESNPWHPSRAPQLSPEE